MRKYIRHPSDIPIEFQLQDIKLERSRLSNVSMGGVAFRSDERVEIGRLIEVSIPAVTPEFKANARVAWCLNRHKYFEIGVQFVDPDDAFRARMVEQVCHIEQYKKDVKDKQGRSLTGEQAAMEWIGKYASEFPPVVKR